MDSSVFTVCIDGAEVRASEGQTVLQAAQAAGIYIPTLCSHPDLVPQGGCKLCVVEIDGFEKPVTSCATLAAPGMAVRTRTERVAKVRGLAMELILASHPADCTSCPSYLHCELQAMIQYIGVTHSRLRTVKKAHGVPDPRNRLIVRDMERCIQCGRCVRACRDLRGVGALAYLKDDDGESYVSTVDGESFGDAGCRHCGACVEVCPTGALRDVDGLFAKEGPRELALVPCRNECPARVDIPSYLRFIAVGEYGKAVAVIREKAPFPLSLGYVCARPCESACKRDKLNEAIAIRALKRHAAENGSAAEWRSAAIARAPATGRRVAVVGGGPAGLTAAYYLARKGHEATVFERLPAAGGMMAAGIPSYRLPREALASELEVIEAAGVDIRLGSPIGSAAELLASGYDAVVVATGAHDGRRLPIPGADLPGVVTAVDFLRSAYLDGGAGAPARVAVLGGGNVAFDCARTAVRLGASEVTVLCLEAEGRMLADADEVEEGRGEGVAIKNGVSFVGVLELGGKASGVRYESIRGFSFESGRLAVDALPGTEASLEADLIVFAAGQAPSLGPGFGVGLSPAGYVLADEATGATGVRGVYAAGDAVYGTKSVIKAIQSGRVAAASADRYLGGDGIVDETLAVRPRLSGRLEAVEGFESLGRLRPPLSPPADRRSGFAAVEGSLDREAAGREAGRCLQCDLRASMGAVATWSDLAAVKSAEGAEVAR